MSNIFSDATPEELSKCRDVNRACELLMKNGIQPPPEIMSEANKLFVGFASSQEEKEKQPRYEYHCIRVCPSPDGETDPANLSLILNDRGCFGWEPFQILPDYTVIFRRPMDSE